MSKKTSYFNPAQAAIFSLTFFIIALYFLSPPSASADISTGLVSHYKLDEVSGTTATDSVGTNNGTLTNGPTFIAGKINNALNLDGVNDYIDLGNPASLQITGAMTISAWVKFDTTNTIDEIITREVGSSDRGYRLNKEANGLVGCNVAVNATTVTAVNAAAVPIAGEWVHYACVYTPSTSIAIFTNGVQNGINTANIPASQRNATVGPDIGIRNGQTSTAMDGLIDDVRVYNRALTAADIAELYNYAGAGSSSQAQSSSSSVSSSVQPTPPPIVTTNSATGITATSAILNATVNNNGLTTVAWLVYGITSGNYEVYSNTTPTQTIINLGNTTISSPVYGLSPNTVYYYRAVAQSNGGTTYGSEMNFTTNSSQSLNSSLSAGNFPQTWQQVPVATKALRYYLESKGITPAGGEGMQFIHALAYAPSNPNIAYMGIDTSTIWKSIDGGTTWQIKGKGINSNGIVSITVDPNNENRVFVTGAQYFSFWANSTDQSKSPLGIYRTLDGGENWTLVKQTYYGRPGDYKRFGANLIAFAGNTIYAGTEKDGLLKSTDGGDTWTTVVAYSAIGRIFDVDVHPTDNSIIYVGSINGLKKVTSGGVVTSIGSGLTGPAVPLLINPQNPLIMFAGDDSNKIMKSTDGGITFTASFTHSNTAQSTAWMAMSPVDPNYVFVSFGQRNWAEPQKDFYYTQNGSASSVTWQTAQSMDEKNQYGWVAGSLDSDWPDSDSWGEFYGGPIAMHPTNKNIALYFAGPGVIKKTTDGGANWRYSNAGFTTLGGSHNRSLLSFDKNKARGIGISSTDRGLYFSDDNGYTFSTFKLPRWPVTSYENRGYGIAVGWGSTEDVIVGAIGTSADQIITVSKNKGSTWTQITTPNTAGDWEYKLITFSPTNSSVIYAGNFRSVDGGTTWTQLSRSVGAVYWGNGDIVYSIGASAGNVLLYKSIDRGTTWTSPYPEIPISFGNVMQIAVSPTNPDKIYFGKRGVGVYILNGSATPILKNENNGLLKDQWGMFNFQSIATDPNNSNVVYVGNLGVGGHDNKTIFRSTDSGNTWETINFNLNDSSINGVVVNPIDSYVYVGTWAGTWKLPPPGAVSPPQSSSSVAQSSSSSSATQFSSSSAGWAGSSSLPSSSSSSSSALPTLTATTKKTLSTITVDGSLNESVWSLTDSINRTISGTNNNIATFNTLWDNNYLYVAVKVLDSILKNDSTYPWQDDSVEIYIDGAHNHSTTYDTNDRQIIKGQGDTTAVSFKVATPNLIHGWSPIVGGYTAEFAIPWSDLNITPSSNMTIGFDLQQNDDDAGGDIQNPKGWNSVTDTNYATTANFGHLTLSATTVGTNPSSSSSSAPFLSSSSSSIQSSSFAPSTKFITGDRVITTAVLNVRSSASLTGTLLGTHALGALGTVVSGPVSAGGYNWYNINYDTAPDGWSAENNLEKVQSSSSSAGGAGSSSATQSSATVSQSSSPTTSTGNTGGGGGGGIFTPSFSYESTLKPTASSTASPSVSTEPFALKPVFQPIVQTIIPLFTQSLSFGFRSDQVRILQQTLSQDKTIYPERLVTGYYGQLTVQAVKRFQAKHSLETTGSVDVKTRTKLNEIYGSSSSIATPSSTAAATTTKYSSLTEAQKQELIKQLQETIKKLLEQIIELLKKKAGM